MQLFFCLAFLCLYLIGSIQAEQVQAYSLWHAGALMISVLVVPCGLYSCAVAIPRGQAAGARTWISLRHWLLKDRVINGVWFCSALVGVALGRWGVVAGDVLNREPWAGLQFLFIVAPGLLSLLACWAAQFRIVQAFETQANQPVSWQSQSEFIRLRVQVYLITALVPVAAVSLGQTILVQGGRWIWGPGSVAPLSLLLVVLVLWALPWLISAAWRTRTMPAGLVRERIQAVAQRMAVTFSDIRIWPTGNRIANALILGSVTRRKTLVVSDGLIQALTADQLAAVVAHESAHVSRHHLRVRTLYLAAPLLTVAAAVCVNPALSEPVMAWASESSHWQICVPWVAIWLAYVVFVIGWLSRRLETEADLVACGTIDSLNRYRLNGDVADDFSQALLALAADSGQDAFRATWLHPSLSSRVLFLREVGTNPALADRFLETLRERKRWILLAWLAVFFVLLWI